MEGDSFWVVAVAGWRVGCSAHDDVLANAKRYQV